MQSDNSVDYEAGNVWNVLGESEIEKHLTDKLYRTNSSAGNYLETNAESLRVNGT